MTGTSDAAGDGAAFRSATETARLDLDRLDAYLAGIGWSRNPDVTPRQFAGGLANINVLIEAGGRPLVLRRPPPGELPPGAHDMTREHTVLSRLGAAFPLAPPSLHLCVDRSVIGVPFQLIAYRPGIVIKGRDRRLLDGAPERCRDLGAMLVATLAGLHAIDPAAVGLDGLGKPDGFTARQIAGWKTRGLRVAEEDQALTRQIGEIASWLEAQRSGQRPARLLHCDFKLDNMILAPETLRPVAVVDWDMATRGDPLFDLATLLSYWAEPGDPEVMHRMAQMPTATAGFPSRAEVAAAYGRATGLEIGDLRLHRTLAMLKLAVVFLQLNMLYLKGQTADPRYAEFGQLGRDLIDMTSDITLGRID